MNQSLAAERVPFWLDPKKRAILYQIATLALVGLLAYYLVSNTLINLNKQTIATGFGFLQKESAFEIGESLIPYSAAHSYGRALLVGALNTLKVAFIGIVLTILLGTVVGIARLSTNWLVAKLAAIYIEVMQDIPVLLQLFFWYAIFYESLPSPRQALNPFAGRIPVQPRGGLRRPGRPTRPTSTCSWPLAAALPDHLPPAALGQATAGRAPAGAFPFSGSPPPFSSACRCWSGWLTARPRPWTCPGWRGSTSAAA